MIKFCWGILFGIANVIPGISGGTVLHTSGMYEDTLIEAKKVGTKGFAKAIKNLTPLILGTMLGILGFSVVYSWLEIQEALTIMFTVIILLMLPKTASGVKAQDSIISIHFWVALIVVVGLWMLPGFDVSLSTSNDFFMYLSLLLAGFVVLIPGFSGALVLVIMTQYDKVLKILESPIDNFGKIIWLGVAALSGVVISVLLANKFVNFGSQKFKKVILGLVIGSVFILLAEVFGEADFSKFSTLFNFAIGGVLGVFTFIGFMHLASKEKKEN